MWLFSLILGLVGGFNPNLDQIRTNPKAYLLGWGVRAAIGFIVGLAYAFIAMPALTGPFWGLGGPLIVLWTFNILFTTLHNAGRLGTKSLTQINNVMPSGAVLLPVLVLLVLVRGVAGWEVFRATDYAALAGPVETGDWHDLLPKPSHLRMVSLEQAEWLGNKVLGEAPGALGSRYQVGRYSIQRVQKELYWVAPLEFHDFSSWMSYGFTEGFVMVSAEDAQRKPRLELGHEMRYLPSAYFGTNLERHVYTNYATSNLSDFVFEVDDDLKPHWVVALTHPSIGYSGEVVEGVLVVNPADGAIQHYRVGEEMPDWVDRVVPERIAEQAVSWWGKYPHGWWNSVWGKRDVMVTTLEADRSEAMWMVWGDDGQPYWFTGLTSAALSDQALTGVALVNSRTGKTWFFALSGPNEEAVMQTVNASVSNYSGYHATQPILYNLDGEPAWVVPVLSREHIFQRLAIVRAATSTVVLGADKASALREFHKTPGSTAKVASVTVTLDRVAADVQNGTTVYYLFTAEQPQRIFTGTSAIAPELVLARPGDKVTLSFIETEDKVIPLSRFEVVNPGFQK